jgi:predicted GNAT superfamily acetyltransferase
VKADADPNRATNEERRATVRIRDAVPADFEQILAMNEEFVRFLSPMDAQRLKLLHDEATYHRVIETSDGVCAFLLAFREDAAYDSVNYLWFEDHLPRFLYIDRVVVSKTAQGRGIGGLLYDDLIAYATSTGVSPITCEFDVDPPNPRSRRFHEAFGFEEVGSHHVGAANKRVSLQALWPERGDVRDE